ncbi:hypothetical protein [Kitasatospora sp. CB01950]|uniref:hypothetical protein n=1 Tax=Kitasatospora sp. CB01950 TaxID=1703930 RepID=UPI001160EB3E|nr:hypothetical protein [Kitasatospora sp. CB01950]
MRKSTLMRATALLIGVGAVTAATVPGATAAPAPKVNVKKIAPVERVLPKAAKTAKTAKAAPQSAVVTPTYAVFNPGDTLKSGESVKVGYSTLTMQADGNLVLYLVADNGKQLQALWSSKTWGNNGAYAVMQADGNFVVYKKDGGDGIGGALWSTGTYGKAGSVFSLDGGELLVFDQTGTTLHWRNDTGFFPAFVNGQWVDQPADSLQGTPQVQGLVQNMWLESSTTILVQQADGNLVSYRKKDGGVIWSSATYGHAGAVAVQTSDGAFAVADNNKMYWNSGTWNNPGAYVKTQSDGNIVVYRQGGGPNNGGALWASGTYGKA